jgi:hypothetical protein
MTAETHPTRFTLERLLAEDLGPEDAIAVEQHLGRCETCKAELAALEADDEAFRAEVPYAASRIEHERRREAKTARPIRLRLWLPGLATAAAVAGVVLWTAVPHSPGEPGTRIKGGPTALTFAVLDAGDLRPGIAGETLKPGTRLQLSYEAGDNTHIAVVGLDAAGTTSRYLPEHGSTLVPLPGGAKGDLPFSLTLDETLGAERFIAVFADHAAPIEGLLHAAAKLSGTDPAILPALDLPEGLSQSTTWIRKE